MQVTLLQPCLLSATVQCSALGLVVPPLSQMKLSLFWAQVVHGGDLSAGKKWLLPQLLLSKDDALWQQSPFLGCADLPGGMGTCARHVFAVVLQLHHAHI